MIALMWTGCIIELLIIPGLIVTRYFSSDKQRVLLNFILRILNTAFGIYVIYVFFQSENDCGEKSKNVYWGVFVMLLVAIGGIFRTGKFFHEFAMTGFESQVVKKKGTRPLAEESKD